MSVFYSPLRYPGGKQKIFGSVKKLIQDNQLENGVYVEPFAGGAGLALSLLFEGIMRRIILNDIDRSIFSFWHSVLYETDALCNMVMEVSVSIEEWERQKQIQKEKDTATLLELGFSTFFMNRTNRSGVINGGIIGGKDQTGNYKINCRFNKKNLIERIRRISEKKDKIKIFNLGAKDFIREINNGLPKKTLIYLDPPYYKKGPNLYLNHYTHEDHEKLENFIRKFSKRKMIITYDNVEEIKNLYSNYSQKKYFLNYNLQEKKEASEVMIFKNVNPQ